LACGSLSSSGKLICLCYKGALLKQGLRLDLLVDNALIVEVKAVEFLLPIHTAQLLTYLRLAGKPLGLILNFNVETMRQGVKRIVDHL